ncbi:MAG: SpoIIE family protein phosphatase [Acidobacteriota bacterium]
MRIQTQLLLAFLLLGVLPLGGIVGFSYVNSQRAISRAASAEAAELSAEMESRIVAVREGLRSRVRAVPWERVLVADAEEKRKIKEKLSAELGAAAPMLEGLTFIPQAPRPPAPPQPGAPGGPGESGGEGAAPAPRPEPAPSAVDSSGAPRPEPALQVAPDIENTSVIRLLEEGLELGDEEVEVKTRIIMWSDEREEGPTVFDFEGSGPLALEPGDAPFAELAASGAVEAALESLMGEEGALPDLAFDHLPQDLRGEAFTAWQEAAKLDLQAVQAEVARELAKQERAVREERTALVFGDREFEIRRDGEVIGTLMPEIDPDRLLENVLQIGTEERGEMPFAIDREGRLYAGRPEDRRQLETLDLADHAAGESWRSGEWVVAMSADPATGLRLGVARPLGDALRELRASAVRNLIVGLAFIGLAILGLLPVSRRLSAGVRQVAEGADRIARGDLETRLPVRGGGELANLARAFNSMAHDVRDHQERLLAGERHRRREEVKAQLMQAELDRQSQELDEARAFQLSMLPRDLPDHREWETAVHIETATEVGGDYYDFRLADSSAMTVVIGDATGHGARAGTMVTVIKSLFTAHSTSGTAPEVFLTESSRTVRRMELGRMAMALAALRLEGGKVVLANAGMPPLLHHRHRDGEVVEWLVPGMPLGGLACSYRQVELTVESGDTLMLYSDGLAEQPGEDGEPAGYEYVKELFRSLSAHSPSEIVDGMKHALARLTAGEAPADDVTILVLRRR